MTNEIQSALMECIDKPPEDLVALYTSPPLSDVQLGIRIRELRDAISYARSIHDHAFIGRPMGLFPLDDAGDSNPFCYVTRGPARGCIIHLYHDRDPVIEYPSLSAFMSAITKALETRTHIDELPDKVLRPHVDQRSLSERAMSLLNTGTMEAECELIVVIQLLDTAQVALVSVLAENPSFFIREAVARLIASHPNAELKAVAESLAKDTHPQVARPGKRALSAVNHVALSGRP